MYNPQLETFIRVAEAGSFSKAAELAYITPTAVIKQINLLETRLGVTLFQRTNQGIVLTDAGASLYQDSKYVIQYCKNSVARAKAAAPEETDVIRVGTSPMTPAQFLVDLWPKLSEYCPGLRLQMVPFDNTPENAREILKNLGQNIDVVAGIFDDVMLDMRQCTGLKISDEPICIALSINHPLAKKDKLTVEDLFGERLMLLHRNHMKCVDRLRDELWQKYPQIQIIDFDFYNTEVFNRCESGNHLLMAVGKWASVHPLLKILPVDWSHAIPFGFLHSPAPSATVTRFLSAVQTVMESDPTT